MNTAKMPFIFRHLAVMPDVHLGKGSTIGSVIPTRGAIIPAAVGVDIGCGMMAARTTLRADDLPDNLARPAQRDREGRAARAFEQPRRPRQGRVGEAARSVDAHAGLGRAGEGFKRIVRAAPAPEEHQQPQAPGHARDRQPLHRGLPRRERSDVWFMLHSGSRGVGNAIGTTSSSWRRRTCAGHIANLPRPRPRLLRGRQHALRRLRRSRSAGRRTFARRNRDVMMSQRDRRAAPRRSQAVQVTGRR
jgi:tRNA-splicing ligase RtcB